MSLNGSHLRGFGSQMDTTLPLLLVTDNKEVISDDPGGQMDTTLPLLLVIDNKEVISDYPLVANMIHNFTINKTRTWFNELY